MKKLHYKQEMQYLNAVAEYIQSLGYEVKKPSTNNRDLLDVWGMFKGKKCFVEIYVTIHRVNNGIMGYWMQGENESEECYLDTTFEYDLDTRFLPLNILDGLKPLNRSKKA